MVEIGPLIRHKHFVQNRKHPALRQERLFIRLCAEFGFLSLSGLIAGLRCWIEIIKAKQPKCKLRSQLLNQ